MTEPPQTKKALVLPPEYLARVGQERTCDSCHQTKIISWSTFGNSKKSKDGVATTCRSCVGRVSVERRNASKPGRPPLENNTSLDPNPLSPRGYPDPVKDRRAFDKAVDEHVAGLIATVGNPKLERDHKVHLDMLKRVTRVLGDPAGFGEMRDERLAFETFMRVMRPCLGGWQELGAIHDDIISALLCHDPQVVLLASRGSAKSTITSMFVAWKLWRNPLEVVLVVSAGENHAKRMLKSIKGFMDMSPLLTELAPEEDQIDSAFQLEVAPAKGRLGMSTSLTCRGLKGQITGLRASLIIADDVENPKHDTAEAVDGLEEDVAELSHIAVPGCETKYLGTPQSPFSLYGRLARNDAFTVFKACLFDAFEINGKEEFESRWPERFTPEDLQQRKKSVSKRQFNLHYRLDLSQTTLKEQPLKLKDLPVIEWPSVSRTAPIEIKGGGERLRGLPRGSADEADDWFLVGSVSRDQRPYSQTIAAIDPAGGLQGKGDAIGLSIVSVTAGGRAVIRVSTGVRSGSINESIQRCAEIISSYGTNKLLIEETAASTFGMTLSSALGSRGWPLIPEKRNTGGQNKGRRIIESISPALASGRLFICKDVLEGESGIDFTNQFTGISMDARRLRNDDIVDSLSYCLAELGSLLAADEVQFTVGARVDYESYRRLPRRAQILNDEELELLTGIDEVEMTLQGQLDRALELRTQGGINDPGLQAHIADLQKQLGSCGLYYHGSVNPIKTIADLISLTDNRMEQ